MNSNGFTYESEKTATPLETYEWDNVWWEHAGEKGKKRLLYIGDSISCAVRVAMNHTPNAELYTDGFGTSKGIDNPYFKESLSIFGKQQGYRDIVLFNNGLHGWHLSTEQYAKHYEEMLKFIMNEFKDAKIAVLTTTAVENKERLALVNERNEAAKSLAQKYEMPIVDIYPLSLKLEFRDGVHFVNECYKTIADEIFNQLKSI